MLELIAQHMATFIVVALITGAALYVVIKSKRLWQFLLVVIICALTIGIYGALYDQLTYSISSEFFTKFKFLKYNFATGDEAILSFPRFWVAIAGFLSTWRLGAVIGVALGAFVPHITDRKYFRFLFKTLMWTILGVSFAGLYGLLYGKYYLAPRGVDWHFPDNIMDLNSFIIAGSMYNYTYAGGFFSIYGYMLIHLFRGMKRKQANDSIATPVNDNSTTISEYSPSPYINFSFDSIQHFCFCGNNVPEKIEKLWDIQLQQTYLNKDMDLSFIYGEEIDKGSRFVLIPNIKSSSENWNYIIWSSNNFEMSKLLAQELSKLLETTVSYMYEDYYFGIEEYILARNGEIMRALSSGYVTKKYNEGILHKEETLKNEGKTYNCHDLFCLNEPSIEYIGDLNLEELEIYKGEFTHI